MSSDLKKNPRQFIMGGGGILGWTDLRSSMGSSNSGGRGILGELIFEVHNNLSFFWGGEQIF